MSAKLVEDYSLIGDGRTAALVRRDGSVDWLCWPRFDSDACLPGLLGTEEHGRWLVGPAEGGACASRRYRADTLVLETDFETGTGAARVTDFMPVHDGAPTLVRLVEGLRGRVRMRLSLKLRFDYGSMVPWVERDGEMAVAQVGPDLVSLRGPVALEGDDGEIRAGFEVAEGDELAFVLSHAPSSEGVPEALDARAALEATQAHWRGWVGRFDRPTDWPEAVRRSLVTLKAMIHRPTGAWWPRPPPRCPSASARTATGTIASPGCATPPSRSRPSSTRASRRRPRPGAAGSCARSRATRTRCGSCTAWTARGGWRSGWWTGCRGSAGPRPCAWATRPRRSASSTSSAR